jgi:hypothetical protein
MRDILIMVVQALLLILLALGPEHRHRRGDYGRAVRDRGGIRGACVWTRRRLVDDVQPALLEEFGDYTQ